MLKEAEHPRSPAFTWTDLMPEVASVAVAFNVTVWPFAADVCPDGYVVVLAMAAGTTVSTVPVRFPAAAMFLPESFA